MAQGKNPDGGDDFGVPPKPPTPLPLPPAPMRIGHGPGVGVLVIGEAAARLGMSRAELEAMIARGRVETLPIEFGRVVPTREVERLKAT